MAVCGIPEQCKASPGKAYELRFLRVNMGGLKTLMAMAENEEYMRRRLELGNVLGLWQTEVFNVMEMVELAEYIDLEDMLRVQHEIRDGEVMQKEHVQLMDNDMTIENNLMFLVPGTRLSTDFPPSDAAVYELQTLKMDSKSPLPNEEATVIGRFTPKYGILNTEYQLLRYPDAKSAQADAIKRPREIGPVVQSRIMWPLPKSKLQ